MSPPFQEQYQAVQQWLGQPLAQPLGQCLAQANGAQCGEYIRLYAPDELLERNQTYEVQSYCPGWLTVGDDGGGRAVMVSPALSPATVYLVDHGSMMREDFEPVAEDFVQWVGQGCPLAED